MAVFKMRRAVPSAVLAKDLVRNLKITEDEIAVNEAIQYLWSNSFLFTLKDLSSFKYSSLLYS
jgi:hypothetical protein